MENLEQQLILKQEETINILKEQVKILNKTIQLLKQNINVSDNYNEILENYNSLLVEELTETVTIASVHGWKSSRYEQGVKLREKMNELSIKLKQ
jgi:hypothetical protein